MSGPPRKATARRLTGPDARDLKLPESNSLGGVAQSCTHPVTRTERFPGGMPHYSHEVCVACGRHLRWHPKPRNVERRKLLAAYVARLLMVEGLTSWEATFLRSMSKRRRLSPKQEAIVERLCRQCLEGAS